MTESFTPTVVLPARREACWLRPQRRRGCREISPLVRAAGGGQKHTTVDGVLSQHRARFCTLLGCASVCVCVRVCVRSRSLSPRVRAAARVADDLAPSVNARN